MLSSDFDALWLTLELAATTAVLLTFLGGVLGYLVLNSTRPVKSVLMAIFALPLVLPPTVLGFYLLMAFSPSSWIGSIWLSLFGAPLAFSYQGILIGSVIFSLPFAVYPIVNAIEKVPKEQIYAVRSFGLSTLQIYLRLLVPAGRKGFATAAVICFAHTIGEFGVVLMIGGSIPGETKVLSVALLEQVELMDYQRAHLTAATLVVLSLSILVTFFWKEGRHQ